MSNIYHYIALDNPVGGSGFVKSRGYNPSQNPDELAGQMAQIVVQEGEGALNEIASLHPDKDLILGATKNTFQNASGGGFSNGCGCSNFSSASGQSAKAEVEKIINGKERDSKTELLIMSGVIVIALALILKK